MKELSTEIILRNGDIKTITVELETELADWLVLQPPAIYRDFLIFEYSCKCVERKETRRVQSLNASLDHGFDIVDEDSDPFLELLRRMTRDQVRDAIKKLEPQQQWLVDEVYFKGRKQTEIAHELGVGKTAIRNRLEKIFEKMQKNL